MEARDTLGQSRVVIDRCLQELPNDTKRYVAQQGAPSVDTLIALLENHRVMGSMMRSESVKHNDSKASRERVTSGRAVSTPTAKTPTGWTGRTTRRVPMPPPRPRCFSCGQEGHLAREWPDRDETMPTAVFTGGKGFFSHSLTTCWAHQGAPAPKCAVKIGWRDTEALLDSGSMVSLVRPQFASATWEDEISVSCIHGDTRKYPTMEVQVITPRGKFTLWVGVVEQLLVPVLFGQDSPLFSRYWPEKLRNPKWRIRRLPLEAMASDTHQACAAVSPDGSPAETSHDDLDRSVHR